MQELLLIDGKPNVRLIQEIKASGGLHKYLDYFGCIILSPIMPDSLLKLINFDTYEYILEELKPDQYLSPDGSTYNGFISYSHDQIKQILELTEKLVVRFPDITIIGLIKGCTLKQMEYHLERMIELGINKFCLHAGDFLHNGSKYSKSQIISYAREIRKKVPYLMIYGIGSKFYFQRFHHANAFVTNSHFIQGFNHMVICGVTWTNFKGEVTNEIIMKNFGYLQNQVEVQDNQCDLTKWISCLSDAKMGESTIRIVVENKMMKVLGE